MKKVILNYHGSGRLYVGILQTHNI